MGMEFFKGMIPRPIKSGIREVHRAWVLRASLTEAARLADTGEPATIELASRLIYGWSNEGWSAKPELVAYLLNNFRSFNGTVVECGSGLSTILLNLLNRHSQARIITLEHHPLWHRRIRSSLERLGLECGNLLLCPLHKYEGFEWYSAHPALDLDDGIDAILCDGPPNSTSGGRYGLIPILGSKLNAGATIIVDDSHRAEEARMIARWIEETDGRMSADKVYSTFLTLRIST